MVCAGNAGGLYGSVGRIQVYKDSTWSSLTLQELAEVVLEYNAAVEELRVAITAYKSDMAELQAYLETTSNAKRTLNVIKLNADCKSIR